MGYLQSPSGETIEILPKTERATPVAPEALRFRLHTLRRLPGSDGDNKLMCLGGLRIKVDTVDSFQGSEANLVCYSTVRTQDSL